MGESRNDEAESDLSIMPPQPTMLSETQLEEVGPKSAGKVTGVDKRECTAYETAAESEKAHTPNENKMSHRANYEWRL